jgi:DNA-binding response OmpR family regulator
LLVEDEEAVLEFERDVLVGAGAEVTTSMSIEDTKHLIQDGAYDVIVMNGIMPGECSAREMYEWIATNCPGREKGLLLTFSTLTDHETRSFLQQRGVPSLAKPFEVADLISQVRALSQREGKAVASSEADKGSAVGAGA